MRRLAYIRRALSACLLAAMFTLLLPALAAAQTWTEGAEADHAFSFATESGAFSTPVRSRPAVVLKRQMLWQFAGFNSDFDPFSVEQLPSGNLLIVSRSNEVLEVGRDKMLKWSYTRIKDDARLTQVYRAQRLPNGNTLIVDRGADFVIEVDGRGREVWRYGASQGSTAPGSVGDPFYAERLANGNTLIADNRVGRRIIEVDRLGRTVWQYGHDGIAGNDPGYLSSPRMAQRLPNGNTLIVDSSDKEFTGERVIEVSSAGDIVWQYGHAGVRGTGPGYLSKPSFAQRLTNGNTLIAEDEGKRMLEVAPDGSLVDLYSPSEYYADGGVVGRIRGLARTPSGTTLICDQDRLRIIEIGYPSAGTVTSRRLDLTYPSVRKTVRQIRVDAECPPGTSVSVQYLLSGSSTWKGSGATVTLPASTTATWIQYRLKLSSTSRAYTPVVRTVAIDYDLAPSVTDTKTATGGGTGTGDGGHGSGHGGTGSGDSDGTGTAGGGSAARAGSGTGNTTTTATGTGLGNGTGAESPSGTALSASGAETRGDASGSYSGDLLAESGTDKGASSGGGSRTKGGLLVLTTCYLLGLAGKPAAHASREMAGRATTALRQRFG